MERLRQWKKSKYFGPVVAFLIPLLVCIVVCIANGVYPFGKYCLLHVDMYHQYCPFFTELMRKLKTGGSLMYSWNIGLGSDFISVFVYYLSSPLNWLLVFCPKGHVIEFMSVLIILKISLAGMCCYLYLQEHFQVNKRAEQFRWMAFVFSTAYALSGFVSAYSWNIMWIDSVAIMPLIILGLEKLVREKKTTLYYMTLAFSILCNYYISIMICIFIVFYFGKLLVEQKEHRLQACVRFAWYSLLAGGTGMVLILPEYKILGYSGSSGMSFPSKMKWYFNILAEVGRGFVTVANYTGGDHWPNLYAGVFTFFLVGLYFFNQRISWRKKLAYGGALVFFYCSFANNYLDFIWHGFHFPDSLPGRQSFLFVFVLLVLSYEQLCTWKGLKISQIAAAMTIVLLLCSGAMWVADREVVDVMSYVITVLFLVAYGLLAIMMKFTRGENRLMLKQMTFVLAMAEIIIHSSITGFYTTGREPYVKKFESYEKLLELAKQDAMAEAGVTDEERVFYRLEDTERLTKNDDALYGYHSTTQFSSLMNINVSHFFQSVYMEGGKNFYCYNGATPISSAMLSVKYFVSEEMLTASPLRTLVGTVDDIFLYKNNYCLPVGYVVDADLEEKLELSTSARRAGINQLGYVLGAEKDTLFYAQSEIIKEPGETQIKVLEDGYFYADYVDCKSDVLSVCDNYGKKTEYSKTTHKYLFDLGYYKSGDVITIKNNTKEEISFHVYRLNQEAVDVAYHTLGQRVLKDICYTDTSIVAKLEEGRGGRLVLAIPKEEGWKLYLDGTPKETEAFEDTFISVEVDGQAHELQMVYETPGLKAGAAISGLCVVLFIITSMIRRNLWKKNS